ncbi:hypothetical protein Q8F55_007485 [Vanrija albida]|uniref:SH3 domain-containing protein n=1 Tax=Vanrija albida TaxID=181172 RepID=A0ABR3PTP0_9TREE
MALRTTIPPHSPARHSHLTVSSATVSDYFSDGTGESRSTAPTSPSLSLPKGLAEPHAVDNHLAVPTPTSRRSREYQTDDEDPYGGLSADEGDDYQYGPPSPSPVRRLPHSPASTRQELAYTPTRIRRVPVPPRTQSMLVDESPEFQRLSNEPGSARQYIEQWENAMSPSRTLPSPGPPFSPAHGSLSVPEPYNSPTQRFRPLSPSQNLQAQQSQYPTASRSPRGGIALPLPLADSYLSAPASAPAAPHTPPRAAYAFEPGSRGSDDSPRKRSPFAAFRRNRDASSSPQAGPSIDRSPVSPVKSPMKKSPFKEIGKVFNGFRHKHKEKDKGHTGWGTGAVGLHADQPNGYSSIEEDSQFFSPPPRVGSEMQGGIVLRDRRGSAPRAPNDPNAIRSTPILYMDGSRTTTANPWGSWVNAWGTLSSRTLAVAFAPSSGPISGIMSGLPTPFSAIDPPPAGSAPNVKLSMVECSSIHSLRRDEARSRGLPSVPEGIGAEVLEMVFADGGKQYICVDGVDGRLGWVGAIWDTLLASKDGGNKEPELPMLTPRTATFPKVSDPLPVMGGEADLPDQPVQKLGDLWIRCGDIDTGNSTLNRSVRGSITAAAPRLKALPAVPADTPPPSTEYGAANLGVPELPPGTPTSVRSRSPVPLLSDEFGGGPVNADVLTMTNVRPGEVVQEVLSASRAGTPAPPSRLSTPAAPSMSSGSYHSADQSYNSRGLPQPSPYLASNNHGSSNLNLSHVPPPRSPTPPSSAAYDGATVEDEDAESVVLAYDEAADESVVGLAYDREQPAEAASPAKGGLHQLEYAAPALANRELEQDAPPPLPPKSPPRKRPLSVVQSRVAAWDGPSTPEAKEPTPVPRTEPPPRREVLRESLVQMFEPAADEPHKRSHRSAAMAERIRAWQPNPRETPPPASTMSRVDSNPHVSESVLSFDPNDLNPSRSASQVRRGGSLLDDDDEPLGALGIVTRRVAAVEAEAPAAPKAESTTTPAPGGPVLTMPMPVVGPRRPRDLREVVEANLSKPGGPRKSPRPDKAAEEPATRSLDLSEPVTQPLSFSKPEPVAKSAGVSEPTTSSPDLSDPPNVTRPLSLPAKKKSNDALSTIDKPPVPAKTKSVDTLNIPVTTPVSESVFLRREREAAAETTATEPLKVREALRPVTPKLEVESSKPVDSLVAARAALLPVSTGGTAPLNIRSRSPVPPRSPDMRSTVSSNTTPRTMGARALAAAAIFEPGIVDRVTSPSVASSAKLATPLAVPSARASSPVELPEPAPVVSRAVAEPFKDPFASKPDTARSTPFAKADTAAASSPGTPSGRKPVPMSALIATFESGDGAAPPTPSKSTTPSVRSFRADMPGVWAASPATPRPRSLKADDESAVGSWETQDGHARDRAARPVSMASDETANLNAPVMDSVLAAMLTPTVENADLQTLDEHLPVPDLEQERSVAPLGAAGPALLDRLDTHTSEHAEISHQLESVHIDVTKVAESLGTLPPDLAQRMDVLNTDVKGVQAAVESSRAEITALLAAKPAGLDKDLPAPPPTEPVEPKLPEINAKLDAIAHLIQEVLSRQADLAKESAALTAAAAGVVAGGAVSKAADPKAADSKPADSDRSLPAEPEKPEPGIPAHAKPADGKMTDSTIPKPAEPASKEGAEASGDTADELDHDLVSELREQSDRQTEQTADIARYLSELNGWLETFVKNSSTNLESMSKRLPEMHDMLSDQAMRSAQMDGQAERLDSLVGMMSAERERALANQGIVDSVVAVVEKQRTDNEMLLRALATDLTTEIRGERVRFIEAMQQATTMNMQIHVDEFKRALSGEVTKSMHELGAMRERKKALEHQIADLFALKAKHNGDTEPSTPAPATPAAAPSTPVVTTYANYPSPSPGRTLPRAPSPGGPVPLQPRYLLGGS